MSSPSPVRGPARETRLLLLTLAVSVAVLFLLARFRFPERPISELAAPQPLARLARATTFDDLSATLTELWQRAGEASVAVRVDGGEAQPGRSRLVPALRVRDDLALAVVSGDARVEAVDGVAVVARDEVRGLVLVRVPAQPAPQLAVQPPGEALDLPGFLVIIDAAPGGPAIRAEFVSRATTHPHPAWDTAVIALGGIPGARPGAMVFTLGGRFVGMVLPDDDETIVVPAEALIARADRLTRGESVLAANPGLAVQPLSPALAKATRSSSGVIIAAIDGAVIAAPSAATAGAAAKPPVAAAGAAAGAGAAAVAAAGAATVAPTLRVGDVIAAIDDEEIRSVGDWERVLGRRAPGTTVSLRIVRRNGTTQVPLMLRWRDTPLAPGDDGAAAASAAARKTAAAARSAADSGVAAVGLALRAASNGIAGLEVLRVDPGSAAARAGLHAGDRITALPGAFAEAAASGAAAASVARTARSPAAAAAATGSATAGSAAAAASTRASAAGSAGSAGSTQTALTLARVDAAFKALASGDVILVAISRAGQPLVVAVEKP